MTFNQNNCCTQLTPIIRSSLHHTPTSLPPLVGYPLVAIRAAIIVSISVHFFLATKKQLQQVAVQEVWADLDHKRSISQLNKRVFFFFIFHPFFSSRIY